MNLIDLLREYEIDYSLTIQIAVALLMSVMVAAYFAGVAFRLGFWGL